ncbi:MAG: CRTAC1 family protein [Deltaproteobacteria bacterium]|nr:CRTAC1 family protein [Deltaproteobacteria bacterium]
MAPDAEDVGADADDALPDEGDAGGDAADVATDGDVAPAEIRFRLAYAHDEPAQSAAVIDWDWDGDLDVVVAANSQIHLLRNAPSGWEVAQTVTVDRAKGFGLFDYDGDGHLDVHIAQPEFAEGGGDEGRDDVWLTDGSANVAVAGFGNEQLGVCRTVVFADLNLDGRVDSLHVNSQFRDNHFPCELHLGTGGGFDPENRIDDLVGPEFWRTWIDPIRAGCGGEYWAAKQYKGAVARDFDRDGRPDVALVAWADPASPDEDCDLGGGANAYIDWIHRSPRGLWVLANASEPGRLRFEEVPESDFAPQASLGAVRGTTGEVWNPYTVVPMDWDRDGDLDLFVLGRQRYYDPTRSWEDTPILRLFRNDSEIGRIRFAEVTEASGLDWLNRLDYATERKEHHFSSGVPMDIDNDGYVDLLASNRRDTGAVSAAYVHVFRGFGDGTFAFVPADGVGLDGMSNDLTYGDLDGDGALDLVVADDDDGRQSRIYLNATAPVGRWIALDVRDAATGTFAFGARVTVHPPGTSTVLGTDEVQSDFSYRGKRTPILHFGLGSVDSVDVHVVRPNGGGEQWFRGLAAGAVRTVTLP